METVVVQQPGPQPVVAQPVMVQQSYPQPMVAVPMQQIQPVYGTQFVEDDNPQNIYILAFLSFLFTIVGIITLITLSMFSEISMHLLIDIESIQTTLLYNYDVVDYRWQELGTPKDPCAQIFDLFYHRGCNSGHRSGQCFFQVKCLINNAKQMCNDLLGRSIPFQIKLIPTRCKCDPHSHSDLKDNAPIKRLCKRSLSSHPFPSDCIDMSDSIKLSMRSFCNWCQSKMHEDLEITETL